VAVYALSMTVRGLPERIQAGVDLVRDELLPHIEQMDGYVGMSIMIDREIGASVVTTAWATDEALRATEGRVGPMRDRAAKLFGGRPEIREWEIAVLHRVRPTEPGSWARVTWTRTDPGSVPQQLDFFRAGVLPEIERLPGFCGTSLLLDREAGTGVIATVYESREALEASRDAALGVRESAVRRMSARLVDVAELEVALAELRVPETDPERPEPVAVPGLTIPES
jgi:heme-degrading monooxygenase HmoA